MVACIALGLEFFEHGFMACRFCGDVCRCGSEAHSHVPSPVPHHRYEAEGELDSNPAPPPASVLVDPEAYDASEERFSASLDAPVIPDENRTVAAESEVLAGLQSTGSDPVLSTNEQNVLHPPLENDSVFQQGVALWKDQVAERLNSYRARRKPRPPRYPSLRLKFESPPPKLDRFRNPGEPPVELAAPPDSVPPPIPRYESNALADVAPAPTTPATMQAALGEVGRIIEFPRSYGAPMPESDELADPVADRPRNVEAPEIIPPAPALGGIVLEPPEPDAEKCPGFEIPLPAASLPRRILAGALDALIVIAACALFGYIFFKMTAFVPPSPQLLALGAGIVGFFWAGFQYLLLVHTGSTPGLRLARLQLSHFDGSPVSRHMRRWRVAASILSALSLGLGFAWCYLDQDALCWHDRITRTYLALAK
jgi:uncharacterized RDD family membrane protein YckC